MAKLPFEQPLEELQKKIEELQSFTEDKGIDMSDEIEKLQKRAENLSNEIYGNLTPWQRLQIARHPDRPTTQDYIDMLFTDFIELHGDRLYGDDPAIVGGIGKLAGRPVTVIGHQKGKDTKDNIRRNFGMPHPEGYRKALRLMRQADKFNRPVICFINTPGAYPGKAAEERGQSEAIARNLREMARLRVPVICIVIGEGGSGGALAIGIGNHVHMLEYTYYSVIAPESAAAILWRDASKGQQAAETMKITPHDLKELGVIHGIIPEPTGGAHHHPKQQADTIKEELLRSLKEMEEWSPEECQQHRYESFRKIGTSMEL